MDMAVMFGPKDPIIECREEAKRTNVPGRYRITAEILLKNGSRRIYRAKAIDRKSAVQEVLTFVDAVQRHTGETVMWRFRGENTYHMGTNFSKKTIFNRIFEFFFDEV
ncbi:MAG: hypothetical protein BAA00_18320 [Parageobacillus thermoglucosidasius]|nr:MAG: hypothetical protein BAA00_18320 [Parageobacillus thermoglucosidasius]